MSGDITEAEFIEVIQRHLTQDPEKFKRYRYSLNDLSKATEADLSTAFIEEHARVCIRASEVNPDAVVALVAPADLEYGLGRMWEMLSYEISWETCAFRNREEAKMWIRERVKERWNITDLTMA